MPRKGENGMKRTTYCGSLRRLHIGQQATVMGWVQTRRDMGGVIFVDVRDREGMVQTVFDLSSVKPEAFTQAERLRNETVVAITGEVRLRDETTYNASLPTGEVELAATDMEVLSVSDPLPFTLDDSQLVREELRLKYRYLDLRRPKMLQRLRYRAMLVRKAQALLDDAGFLQVETPILCRSTPEGARDYLVPSRVHEGTFYALPQSPQIYKQLLMVGGIDRYYQVARCFRDEDLRADRQPEFTQVDMEMSFVEQEDVLCFLRDYFARLYEGVTGRPLQLPFKRLTWQEAMDTYGNDKPDLRFGLPIVDVTDIAAKTTFSIFQKAIAQGGVVRALCVKGADRVFTRATIEAMTDAAVKNGAKGMAWILYKENGEINSILPKYFPSDALTKLEARLGVEKGDFVLFCADELDTVRRVMSVLRVLAGETMGLIDHDAFQFALVTDFPMFEYKKDEKRFAAMHHPFTMPNLDDLDKMMDDRTKLQVRSQAYDVVLNGVELGSGSVRIHRRDVQARVFEALGFSDEEAQRRFGFLLGAFRYGTPPHAGFAFGVDRLCMLLTGAASLRDVIAFPKTKDASCLMTGAPDTVDQEQLDALRLSLSSAERETAQVKQKQQDRMRVEQTAVLSMLSLSSEEREGLGDEFARMLDFAGELGSVTAETPEGCDARINVSLRADEPRAGLALDRALSNAPSTQGRYVTVPRVVGEEAEL